MLHNTVLVSVAQQSESAICIHMSPYPLPLEPPSHPPYPTPLGHRKAPSQSPCAMLLCPTSQLFYVGSVYMSMLLSFRPGFTLPPHVLKSIFYVYLFIPALQLVHLYYFSRFHIYGIFDFLFLTLLCMTVSRSIHVSTNNPISFLFMAE